jgi:hypothetical protein
VCGRPWLLSGASFKRSETVWVRPWFSMFSLGEASGHRDLFCFVLKLCFNALKIPDETWHESMGFKPCSDTMLQFVIFFVLSWGMAYPDSLPDQDKLIEMPGSWNDNTAPPIDEILMNLMLWVSTKQVGYRGVFVLYALMTGFWLAAVLSTLFVLVPFAGWAVLFWCFGVVPTVSWAWTLLLGLMLLVSAVTAGIQPLWVFVSRAVVLKVLEFKPDFRENLKSMNASMVSNIVLAARSRRVETVVFEGKRFTAVSLEGLNASDPAMAFAIASAMMYCPVPRQGWSAFAMTALLCGLYLSRKFYSAFKLWCKAWFWYARLMLVLIFFGVTATPQTIGAGFDLLTLLWTIMTYPLILWWRGGFKTARRYVRLLVLVMLLKMVNGAFRLSILTMRHRGSVKGLLPTKQTWRTFWNNTIMDLGRLIDDIALPHFIRALPDSFDANAINETQSILAGLGWPVSDTVIEGDSGQPSNIHKFKTSVIGHVPSVKQGIHQLQLKVADELSNLAGLAPEYKRTEQYATPENELESLSRYFETKDIDLPDIKVDEVFVLVGDIFANSRLVPFNFILKKWEKKYGLGPFWRDPDRKGWKKLSRRKFIKHIGGMAEMVKLWARTFEVAPGLVPVAPVSVKGEALPPKKWLNDRVRTVIGSPIAHYIMSTVWNYWPNHNFRYWSTNIKIGMPLNGHILGMLIAEHSGFDHHFAGDFHEFDSTVAARVSAIIKQVRKKGFERHRDYAKICFLIDANYDNLLKMPLMTTSTGNIFAKRTGLSTGHSSTGMDNSLAVTIYYLIAWKDLTGLSAHEFRYYNKLSNYGDDHLLSWRASAPSSWHPDNIIKSLAKCKVTLRDEEPSRDLNKMEFLSKIWRKPLTSDVDECREAGIPTPAYIVIHNPRKLVGKAYAPSKDVHIDPRYRAKRLVSYLYLTAHQRDLYDKLRYDIDLVLKNKQGQKIKCPVPIPSYSEVISRWHDPATNVGEPETEVFDDETPYGQVMDYTMSLGLDTLVSVLSVIPDVVNPAIYNMGYTNYVVGLFGARLSWPVELIRRSNSCTSQSHLVVTLKKTCYDFLADHPSLTSLVNDETAGALMLRHWIFIASRGPSMTPAMIQIINWMDKKGAAFNFVLNGHVQPVIRRLDFPLFQIILICLLAYLPEIHLPAFVNYIRIPSFSYTIEALYGLGLNTFWSKVPANMKQADQALKNIGPESPCVLVEAPTGTGKSTTFVNYVWRYHRFKFKRVIVVVPRQLLVLTLTPYLRSAFSLPAVEVTEGFAFDANHQLIVTTPNEVLLHNDWLTEGNLFLLDEAHVLEPVSRAVQRVLASVNACRVMMTATPSIINKEECSVHVPLTIASTWEVEDRPGPVITMTPDSTFRDYFESYRTEILGMTRRHLLSRFLIFVVDNAHAEDIASRIGRRTCILSSKNKSIDTEADIFIATAVADVGLTIPDVNWVITSNLTRKQILVNGKAVVKLTTLDGASLRQRRGRTGRTSNGLFTVVRYINAPFVDIEAAWTDVAVGLEALKAGAPPGVIARFFPSTISALWSSNYDRTDDQAIDAFTKNMTMMRDELEAGHQRSFRTTFDGVDFGDFWTIQGNTLPTNLKTNGEVVKVTGDFMFDFLVGAALELVKRKTQLKPEDFRRYIRRAGLSSQTFIALASDPEKALASAPVPKAHETARFGPRFATKMDEEPYDLLEGFNSISNPAKRDEIVAVPVEKPKVSRAAMFMASSAASARSKRLGDTSTKKTPGVLGLREV